VTNAEKSIVPTVHIHDVVLAVPLVAATVLVALAGAIFAPPYLLVRHSKGAAQAVGPSAA
jgi:hypothetical protein